MTEATGELFRDAIELTAKGGVVEPSIGCALRNASLLCRQLHRRANTKANAAGLDRR